ncbi:MAG: Hydrogenase maturation factor HybF [Phycisphaerae bacterium]|nr:Hydrogenase maturation factor HybF [Phycisphaerae bacterium]
MHETFLATQLVGQLEELVAPHAPCRLARVRLRVGALQQVVGELLQFAFEVAARGTAAEGAELAIHRTAGVGRCRACGAEFAIEQWCYLCPRCESGEVAVAGGDEFVIETMTLEKDEDERSAAVSAGAARSSLQRDSTS